MTEMESQSRTQIAEIIRDRILSEESLLKLRWRESTPTSHVFIDEVLPEGLAHEIFKSRPSSEELLYKRSLKEKKRVGVEIDSWNPIVRDATLALQSAPVMEAVGRITEIDHLIADQTLYAAGISVMKEGDFLQPHLDNSHDGDQQLYRVLNLLFYLTPDWNSDDGGNLELWDPQIRHQTVVDAKFNRLVIMRTDESSWHSVQKIRSDVDRVCLSSYFFRQESPENEDYRHVTFFVGRPGQVLRNLALRLDGHLRSLIAKLFPQILLKNPHRRRDD